MPHIDTPRLRLFYEQRGEGPDLLLIMGLGAPGNMWQPLLPLLERHFRVTSFDNRGVGLSDLPPDPFTMEDMGRDALALLDALGIDRTHVAGVSMGGMVALQLALLAPRRVERLVLMATSAGGAAASPPAPWVIERLTRSREGKSSEQIVREAAPILFTEGFVERHPEVISEIARRNDERPTTPEGVQRQLAAIMTHDVADRLGAIGCPTLVLHGEADVLVPPENARPLAERIPHAELRLLPGVAHGLIHEATTEVAEAIAAFCLDRARNALATR